MKQESRASRYYGKYRGTVFNNIDPEQRGRIQAVVPDVQGFVPTSWAMPCVPIAGKQQGLFMIPQLGAGVWIEFEQGDPDYPIWVGGFWGAAAEVPLAALATSALPSGQTITLQTTLQHSVTISDAIGVPVPETMPSSVPLGTGGIMLRSPSGAMIVVNDAGIFINNGHASINLLGGSVFINKVALVVT